MKFIFYELLLFILLKLLLVFNFATLVPLKEYIILNNFQLTFTIFTIIIQIDIFTKELYLHIDKCIKK